MNSYFSEQYITYFNKFTEQIKVFYPDDTIIKVLDSISDEDKLKYGKNFVSNLSDENFDLFLQSKLKVFSHKNNDTKFFSESLFGSQLALKQLLNNQTDEIKKTIWAYIHVLYLYAYLLQPIDNQNEERVKALSNLLNIIDVKNIENTSDINSRIYNLLNVDVNDDTKTMIDDIVKSFNPLLDGNNKNPLANIMEISQKISSKYSDKISNGNIELDKIMDSIKTKVPGMENIINNFTDKNNKNDKPKEKIIINDSYSTSNIEVGEDEFKNKTNFNIGKILKTADSLGLVPNKNKNDTEDNSIKLPEFNTEDLPEFKPDFMPDEMPDMTQLMGLLGKLQNNNSLDLNKEFSDMGIDMNAINKQMSAVMGNHMGNVMGDDMNNLMGNVINSTK